MGVKKNVCDVWRSVLDIEKNVPDVCGGFFDIRKKLRDVWECFSEAEKHFFVFKKWFFERLLTFLHIEAGFCEAPAECRDAAGAGREVWRGG